jgi:predicted GNAT family N-acyltransferase
MKDIELKEIEFGSKEYKDELELRNKILRLPLGLDIYDEDLKGEKDDSHIGAFLKGKLFGVLILTYIDKDIVRMRQVAVHETLRSRGIGRRLVEYSEDLARSKGHAVMMLHARMTVTDFYKKLGYEVTSESFTEVMIPHVEMKKKLS